MADFTPYEKYEKTERVVDADNIVRLTPDRWQLLVDYIRTRYAELRFSDEITVHEPVKIDGVLFLPAIYRKRD